MHTSEYKNIFKNESTHFYYVANHKIIIELVKKFLPNKNNLEILDAGCGTGLLASKLKIFGDVRGVDISNEALKYARKRNIKVKLASINKIPFKHNTFDLIVSLDVLYHKKVNDQKAIMEFNRVLKPNGILILRVAANKWLKSSHDRLVHTRQRYNRAELTKKLIAGNFKIQLVSYINSLLLIPAIISLLLEKFRNKKPESGVKPISKNLNSFLIKLLLIDIYLLKILPLPFGLGIIAVARKN